MTGLGCCRMGIRTGRLLIFLSVLTVAAPDPACPSAIAVSSAARNAAGAGTQPEPGVQTLARIARIVARAFQGQNAWWLVGGAAGALLAHPGDQKIQTWWQDRRPPQSIIRTADVLGDFEFHVPAVLAFWGAARLAHNARLTATGAALAEGYLVSKALTMTLKTTVRRQRPDRSNRLSFPSGHASGAFALATVITCRHGPEVGLPFLSLAAFTTAMRLAQQKHYLSDILVGAAIGVAVGRAAAGVHRLPQASKPGLKYLPMPGYPLAVRLCW